ncbi:proline iminopeptidase-family hydrolase [Streptomyces sp. NPDC056503]|uniref:proline iminopeptidase-family hydrolase n=1 Tax=Streptomyces sp. NPDC056503 TaxID=3345842 RepID=UPI0036837D79
MSVTPVKPEDAAAEGVEPVATVAQDVEPVATAARNVEPVAVVDEDVAADAKGTVPYGPYETWYRVTGDLSGGRPPLVVVHGGPGSPHDYLLPLAALAARTGHPVVHYDQLGNGGSTRLPDQDPGFWTVQLFLDELDNLIGHLGIVDGYVLFGHSWGGMLAARHAAERPAGLRGLVVANSPASYPLWRRETKALRDALPPGVDATLRRHEAAGTTTSAEYREAVAVFYERHVCRVTPWPRAYTASLYEVHDDPTVYATMNGPSEFHVTGTLRDWTVEPCLGSVTAPTLILSGRHDEATEAAVRPYQELIPDSRWELFEHSSHMPHLEEPDRFQRVVADFLTAL